MPIIYDIYASPLVVGTQVLGTAVVGTLVGTAVFGTSYLVIGTRVKKYLRHFRIWGRHFLSKFEVHPTGVFGLFDTTITT